MWNSVLEFGTSLAWSGWLWDVSSQLKEWDITEIKRAHSLHPDKISIEEYEAWNISKSDLYYVLVYGKDPIARHEAAFVAWAKNLSMFHHLLTTIVKFDKSVVNVHESIEALAQYQWEYSIESLWFFLKLIRHREQYSSIQPLLKNEDVIQTLAFAIRKSALEVAIFAQSPQYDEVVKTSRFMVPETAAFFEQYIHNDTIRIAGKDYSLGIHDTISS